MPTPPTISHSFNILSRILCMPHTHNLSRTLLRFSGCRQRIFHSEITVATGTGKRQTRAHLRYLSCSTAKSRLPTRKTILGERVVDRQIGVSPRTQVRTIASTQRIKSSSNTTPSTPNMARKDKKEANAFQLKVPKGTKDWAGADIALREYVFSTIIDIFKRHGAQQLDTPVFELKEILAGKYGEDSKLIYDLQDQGGELCSLRYDLTVPFARWLAMNNNVGNIKRYHIAKVYRRDQPAMTKGRMREFYQCDIDFAGSYDPLVPDAEIVAITKEVFTSLGLKDFKIKINNRKILDAIFEVCGVPADKIRPISSAVDKLDKLPWEEVKKEMVEQKGLEPEVADKIWTYVQLKGFETLDTLRKDPLYENAKGKEGVEDMDLLFKYCEAFNCKDALSFDLSLARGLDYYTGCIWEVVTAESAAPASSNPAPPSATTNGDVKPARAKKDKATNEDDDRSDDPTVGVGSVAAGGRYDKLVGMFSNKGDIPCVGISFGIDRILSVLKKRLESQKGEVGLVRPVETDCYVMAFGSGMLVERMAVTKMLWEAGLKAGFQYKVKARVDKQFKVYSAAQTGEAARLTDVSQEAETLGAPFAIILAEEEWARGEVKVCIPPLHIHRHSHTFLLTTYGKILTRNHSSSR